MALAARITREGTRRRLAAGFHTRTQPHTRFSTERIPPPIFHRSCQKVSPQANDITICTPAVGTISRMTATCEEYNCPPNVCHSIVTSSKEG
jgi:hypothetical protein